MTEISLVDGPIESTHLILESKSVRMIPNENIIRVYRIFLKITAIGMEEVRKGVVCSTSYSLLKDILMR